ncbi:Glu/Leu/Phe/Val dehydrogenase dimerization domain-containing protein [Sanyastnella coralliicola]|uniref:Glu/Leu/Phe/Val dehydrogenase dimerization domain-containing protein n=1 Tax=Sanyastnella coralliicola TaxID=3069118 RepID=UPI0027BAA3B2|nr:Glu/Leu/Phe/Val dehydrogenase dimerization domain-containing protein [Longitalea sp. SCSIO 12813]
MKDLLKAYEEKQPEVVFEWKDPFTDAQGWVVINSLRGGAAGGGTRMRVGLDKREVESLAKTMEIKFTVSGPQIGGAKSGINFDPRDPRKKDVLERWYQAVTPLLKHYYGTGGDLNVDEIHEVIPITEDCGVWHPQEGVFNGHFQPNEAQKVRRIGQLRQGVIKVLEDEQYSPDINKKYCVADMITGYGVAEAVNHYYNIYGGEVAGKRVVVQGWGNVGSAAAYYLAHQGAKIVGIIDRVGGIINQEGLSTEEVTQLFLNKDGNALRADNMLSFEEVNEKVWDLDAEVFLPCAASRLITKDQIERMINSKLEVVSSGANVPFADPEIFYGAIAEYADQHVAVIPDFIANCGMARVFAYLMSTDDVNMSDESIFNDTSDTIKKALEATYAKRSDRTHITETAFEISLNKLMK